MDSNLSDGRVKGGVAPNLSLLLSSSAANAPDYFSTISPAVAGANKVIGSNGKAGSGTTGITPPPSTSTAGTFLLGIHNQKTLGETDLPEFVKEHNATLSFPEKLMLMLTHIDKLQAQKSEGSDEDTGKEEPCISWVLNGRAFIIRDRENLVKDILPLFFKEGKFASFTRKLYRWGFRQVNVGPDRIRRGELIFGHDHFQRDNKQLMVGMRSITAAGKRRAAAARKREQEDIAYASMTAGHSVANSAPFLMQNGTSSDLSIGSKRPASGDLQQQAAKRAVFSNPQLSRDAVRQLQNQRLLQLGSLSGGMPQGYGPLYQQQGMLQANDQLARQYLTTLSQLSLNNNNATNSDQIGLQQGQSQENSNRMQAAIDMLLRFS